MLKITVEPGIDAVRLKLEGDLAGTGVRVLEEFWLTTSASVGDRAVCLDLSGVSRVDDAGRFLLALIHRTGASFEAAGVEMKELVESITRDWPTPQTAALQADAPPRRGPRA